MQDNYLELLNYILGKETEGISLAGQFVMLLVEAFLVFIPGIILYKKGKIKLKRLWHIFFLVAYAGVILSFTVFRRSVGSRTGIVNLYINLGFGLKGYAPSLWGATFSILNILLFIPWGVIICPFFRNNRRLVRIAWTTFIGMLTSISIESIQLISGTGMFEITDIVTNTAGTFVGAVLMGLF